MSRMVRSVFVAVVAAWGSCGSSGGIFGTGASEVGVDGLRLRSSTFAVLLACSIGDNEDCLNAKKKRCREDKSKTAEDCLNAEE